MEGNVRAFHSISPSDVFSFHVHWVLTFSPVYFACLLATCPQSVAFFDIDTVHTALVEEHGIDDGFDDGIGCSWEDPGGSPQYMSTPPPLPPVTCVRAHVLRGKLKRGMR
jgi:hypothetical protein